MSETIDWDTSTDDWYDLPASSKTRTEAFTVCCGTCKDYHESASDCRSCWATHAEWEAEARAEMEIERRTTQRFEEGRGHVDW